MMLYEKIDINFCVYMSIIIYLINIFKNFDLPLVTKKNQSIISPKKSFKNIMYSN